MNVVRRLEMPWLPLVEMLCRQEELLVSDPLTGNQCAKNSATELCIPLGHDEININAKYPSLGQL